MRESIAQFTARCKEPVVKDSDAAPGWSPWRIVVGFGLVSLAGDMVYEGARPGPVATSPPG